MYSYSNFEMLIATLGILFVVLLIICIPLIILYIVGLWRLFQKAGKNGWEAIIPFYNSWVLVEISGLSWWYFLLMISDSITTLLDIDKLDGICSLISIVVTFFCCYNISKKLHNGTGFAVLMTLFPLIVIPIIGLSSRYSFDQTVPVSKNGPIKQNDQTNQSHSTVVATDPGQTNNEPNSNDNSVSSKFCPYCGKKLDENVKFCGNCGEKI